MTATSRLALISALMVSVGASAGAYDPGCLTNPNRVGACRPVHGRLSLWNGSPGERIWVVGTNRLLGVTGRGEDSLPPYLAKQLTGTDRELYGDFWVCTLFDPPKERHMESVCVHTWRNLVLQELPADDSPPVVRRISAGP